MACSLPPEVEGYIIQVESGTYRTCRYQKALVAHIRNVFQKEQIYVDETKLAKYMGMEKYMSFKKLFPWEKFLTALWLCTYTAPGLPRWHTLFTLVGRGAGKDGLIAYTSLCLVSPFNGVEHYDVDICANNEEQAITPVNDIVEALEDPQQEKRLGRHFYHTKEKVQGRKNHGRVRGRANNPKGRDGMRSGAVVFNEVHAYENYANIDVFKTGLGKVAEPRIGYFTSNGDVDEGPLDDLKDTAEQILFEGLPDGGFLPFICILDDEEEVHDPENWYKANPSLQYMPALRAQLDAEYTDWKLHPDRNGSFMTKRMGLRRGRAQIAVTNKEKIMATKGELPDLSGKPCTVGIDYAELNDWASVDLHFRVGEERYDVNHTWVCTQSQTLDRVRAPWREWATDGHITVVDDPTIDPDLLAEYIREQGRKYQVKKLAADHYRWTAISEAMVKIGFDAKDKNKVKLVRPSDIMMIEPVIQTLFDRRLLHWGKNPVIRWACNNTMRVRASKKAGSDTGNFYYAKIEAKSRKTDPFMAFVAAMCIEQEIGPGQTAELPPLPAFKL